MTLGSPICSERAGEFTAERTVGANERTNDA